MSLTLDLIFLVISVVTVSKFIFEVFILLYFDLNLNVGAAPIFLDRPENLSDQE